VHNRKVEGVAGICLRLTWGKRRMSRVAEGDADGKPSELRCHPFERAHSPCHPTPESWLGWPIWLLKAAVSGAKSLAGTRIWKD
jgi:hypothetical protein